MTTTDRDAMPAVGIDTASNPGTKYLTLTYRENALSTGITVNVQSSADLQTWTTVTPDFFQQTGIDPATGDPIMEAGVAVTSSPKQYIRLKVTKP